MRLFLIGAFSTILILIGMLGYRQNIFQSTPLPYDDEQTGLNNQVIIHFSHVVAENTPKGIAAARFAELVKEKSKGKLIVQIHANGILYNDNNELEALREGKVQMIAPTFSKLTNYLPSWQVLDLPFLIENNEQLAAILTGDLSKSLLDELHTLDIKGLTFWSNGFKQIAAKHKTLEIKDFAGKQVRVMPSNILEQQIYLLGGKPIATSFNDIYSEISVKQIDAQETVISNLYSKGLYSIQNHITLSNHGILAYSVMMNENFWKELSPKNQQIITESLNEMSEWQHEHAVTLNEQNLNTLRKTKNVFLYELSEKEFASWKQATDPLYTMYEKQLHQPYYKQFLNEINGTKK